MSISNKNILLGVTGSIAAYKAPEIVRRLQDQGATVQVVMTEGAKQFITPLTLQAISGRPVRDALFDVEAEAAMSHIELARWADVVLIAPASAESIARLVAGRADDLLSTVCVATEAQVVVAPAMNQQMWQSKQNSINVEQLMQRGVLVVSPESGYQACGEVGPGRLAEPDQMIDVLKSLFSTGVLEGRRVLITAGPTLEAIDPVRFISNHSSGKMGYAMAEAAVAEGAQVMLVSGPVHLSVPEHVDAIQVQSAQQMFDAVMAQLTGVDLFIGVAAVSDYQPKTCQEHKIKKTDATMTLTLERTPDILKAVAAHKNRPFVVGFAAETERLIEHATQKRERKNVDAIIANAVGKPGQAFHADENEVVLITSSGQKNYSILRKSQLARLLMQDIALMLP